MSSRKIPPEKVHVFRERPLGLRLGSRNGINYVYAIDKPKPAPPKPQPNSTRTKPATGQTTTMAQIQYDKLKSLLSLRIMRVQEINVELYSLSELAELLNTESLPMYVTFGEDIGLFEDLEQKKFDPDIHLSYFKSMITGPPAQYASMDVQRITLLFFSIFAVDLLCDLDVFYSVTPQREQERKAIIEWIYAQQIISSESRNIRSGGFRGGSFLGVPYGNNQKKESERLYVAKWDRVNMASTHNAICVLIGLGDDLKRLDRKGIIETLKMLQDPVTGSYCSMIDGEVDMRFVYCACVVSHLLNDWSGINTEAATTFIASCQSYDGSLGFGEDMEGHGGSTFVGVAALVLMNTLHRIDTKALMRWLMFNQGNGFIGRPEKPPDSCYSFWCGAVLSMLSSYKQRLNAMKIKKSNGDEEEETKKDEGDVLSERMEGMNLDADQRVMDMMELKAFYHSDNKEFYNLCNHRFNRVFNLYCQSGFGGFAKLPHIPYGDILHGYMGLAGLSMMAHQTPKELLKYERYPHLFKKKLFPMTSCAVSYHDIAVDKGVDAIANESEEKTQL